MDAWRAGFFPVRWSGTWPDGHLEVYCPPDRPQAALLAAGAAGSKAPAKVPSAKSRQDAVLRRHREHPGLVDAPAQPTDHLATWRALASAPDRVAALTAHLAPLATRPGDADLLRAIAAQVMAIAIADDRLVITLRTGEGDGLQVIGSAPWSGAVTRMPADLLPVLRRHNGLRTGDAAEWLELYAYDGERFLVDTEDWYQPEPLPSDDPFSAVPLIAPLSNGSDLFLYHPTDPQPDGSARFLCLNHENGRMDEVMPSGAGGTFLRMLADRLDVPSG
ncbi:MAG: hypothetical protein H0W72_11345 [Planctomycetes bacterium]|nr:hypothetical protein [Planctomycetota bacterium]